MKWRPSLRTGMLIGGGIILLILLADVALLWRVLHGPLDGEAFVSALLILLSLAAIASVGYRLYDLGHLHYEFDRNRVLIATGAATHVIPMNRIIEVVDSRKRDLEVRIGGLAWPGCWIGQGNIEGMGLTLFYAAARPQEQVILVTPTLSYAISPPDMETFLDVFRASQELGAIAEVKQESRQSAYVRWAIWNDRIAQGILLGNLVLCVLLFAILCFRYPRLPSLLPMHYDAAGQVDRIASRAEMFDLPVIALLTFVVNGLLGAVFYRRERVIAYLAWSGALVVQGFFLLALRSIVM